jgi:alcohol dehydrogenase
MSQFKSLRIRLENGSVSRQIETCSFDELPDHDVLIRVHYSCVNYKDALSANGHKGISRHYPHTPGIDAVGTVVSDRSNTFSDGTEVVVIGFDLGMNTWGGLSEYIRVPVEWVMALPKHLTKADSMRLGTAGVTAGYCLEKLLQNGLCGKEGHVLVTGATGGVGSIAVHLLATLGYTVTASTGKASETAWLNELGARNVVDRDEFSLATPKALRPESYIAAIDTVGQDTLVNILKLLKYGGSVAACGMVGGTAIPVDIFPFILRNVNLLGIASADASLRDRQRVLAAFTGQWKLPKLNELCDQIELEEVSARIDDMLLGNTQRRALVKL